MVATKEKIQLLKKDELIILLDDLDLGSAYLVGIAEYVTYQKVNLLTKLGKGLVSVCISQELSEKLKLKPMVNQALETCIKPFAVSVDYKSSTTGISAFERAMTIKAFTDGKVQSDDFIKPGHIFPLIGHNNGLLGKFGIVEAVIDLAKSISCPPVGYVCEILDNQGYLASIDYIKELSNNYHFPILKLSEVINKKLNCKFKGLVIQGNQIGRKIGFPTANLHVNLNEVRLPNGVYGVKVTHSDKRYLGIMNIGLRPTVEKDNLIIHHEVHLLDFEQTIYGEQLLVEVCFFLRNEISFSNIEELIAQIKLDIDDLNKKFEIYDKRSNHVMEICS